VGETAAAVHTKHGFTQLLPGVAQRGWAGVAQRGWDMSSVGRNLEAQCNSVQLLVEQLVMFALDIALVAIFLDLMSYTTFADSAAACQEVGRRLCDAAQSEIAIESVLVHMVTAPTRNMLGPIGQNICFSRSKPQAWQLEVAQAITDCQLYQVCVHPGVGSEIEDELEANA
jgi:hypothetical protein